MISFASTRAHGAPRARLAALGQGAYYLLTGVWPLLHMRSFIAVTGPKRDVWLVRTVGALIAVIGGTLLLGARRQDPRGETRALAVGSAAALTAVDVTYVARGTIAPIYLLDAVAELLLIGAWGSSTVRRRRRTSTPRRRPPITRQVTTTGGP